VATPRLELMAEAEKLFLDEHFKAVDGTVVWVQKQLCECNQLDRMESERSSQGLGAERRGSTWGVRSQPSLQ